MTVLQTILTAGMTEIPSSNPNRRIFVRNGCYTVIDVEPITDAEKDETLDAIRAAERDADLDAIRDAEMAQAPDYEQDWS